MPEIKKKPGMIAPKVRQSNATPKETAGILRKQYEEKEKTRQPEPKGPVQYATNKTEMGGRRAALLAADCTRRAARQVKQRKERREKAESTEPRKESAPAARECEPEPSTAEPQHNAMPSQPTPQQVEHRPIAQRYEHRPQQAVPKTRQRVEAQERTDFVQAKERTATTAPRQRQAAPKTRQSTLARSDAEQKLPQPAPAAPREQPIRPRQVMPKVRQSAEPQARIEVETPLSPPSPQQHRGRQKVVQDVVQKRQAAQRATSAEISRVNGAVKAERDAIGGVEQRIPEQPTAPFYRKEPGHAPAQKPINRMTEPKKSSASKAAFVRRPVDHTPAKPTFTPKERATVERQARKAVNGTAQAARRMGEQKLRQEAVKKSVETTKEVAKRTVQATKRVAQAAVKAVKAAVSSVAALGGGAVLLVVLVIVALIAAIVASPFGIFFSNDSASRDTVPISAAIAQVNFDFNARLEELQGADTYDDITVIGSTADWAEILAVFAAKVAGSDGADAADVATIDTDRIDRLEAVFWDMNAITTTVETIDHPDSNPSDDTDDSWTEKILHITLTPKAAADMPSIYSFTARQADAMNELLTERAMLEELVGSLVAFSTDAAEIMKQLPADLSQERREVVRVACSLVGKVNYFWGGKSLVLGWDSRWGTLQKVWAEGNSTTGTYRPFGLDCSGFVDWVFYNASNGAYVLGHGGGATMQHTYCTPISWEGTIPGDLVFYPDDMHVGIVGGRDEIGNLLIIHCASSYNCVVITGVSGFTAIARPQYYSE